VADKWIEGASGVSAAAASARVVVATYEHKHGLDVRAFQSEQGALRWRMEIADRWWDDEFDDERPAAGDIGQAYFENIEGEFFNIHDVAVEVA